MTSKNVLLNTTLLALYQFTVRRGDFCLRRIREILVSPGYEGLVPSVDRALEVYGSTKQLEDAYHRSGRNRVHGHEAGELDSELMRALGAFEGGLALTVNAFGDSPKGKTAHQLHAALFPNGVGKVSVLSFVEKEAEVTGLLSRLASEPELARAVSELGISDLVERLTEVTERYRAVIQVKKPTWDEVREARRACQEQLIRVTVQLLARRVDPDLSPEEGAALDLALGEVLGHQDAIRRHRRLRRDPEAVEDEPVDELGFDDAADEGPAPEDDVKAEEEKEPGAPAMPPIAQPLDPPTADHDGAGAGAA